MKTKEFLSKITAEAGTSGYEHTLSEAYVPVFKELCDEVRVDRFGNLIAVKKGDGNGKIKIMFAAHIDEIGLMVSDITDDGFLKFTTIGGVDPRTLPGQIVSVFGKEKFSGIIAVNPEFLLDENKAKRAFPIKEMFIDTGECVEKVKNTVRVGDLILVNRELGELKNRNVYAKALDDRAGVAVLLEILRELSHMKNHADVYCVATTQEELGYRGAIVSSFAIQPDIGIAIDVTHGHMPGVPEDDTSCLGGGPVISKGPHVHPGMFKHLSSIADKYGIKWQMSPSTSPRGTDTWALQIANQGIPSALVSLPLRYMHTSVEVASLCDIEKSARLLALFIAHLNDEVLEGLKCYYND